MINTACRPAMSQSEESMSWELPIDGLQVQAAPFGSRIDITAYGQKVKGDRSAPSTRLSFGVKLHCVESDVLRHGFDAVTPWESMMLLLGLRNKIIVTTVADNNGHTTVLFNDGSTLRAESDEHFENWEVVGPDGINLGGISGAGDHRISGTDSLRVVAT
jgi:hypothetical protein